MGWPEGLTVYKLVTDWGSGIGGVFALIAGGAAYVAGHVQARATRQAAADQIAALNRKDRLQAQGMAVGIYPELLLMQAATNRAALALETGLSPDTMDGPDAPAKYAEFMRVAVPPLLERNLDNLFLIEHGGASLTQLVSIIMQYNYLLEYIAKTNKEFRFADLEGHLKGIGLALDDALREIIPLHDQATGPPRPT